MRTTIDIPEDLLRRAKAVAALRGMKLKDLVASILAKGLAEPPQAEAIGHDRPIPVQIPSSGRTIPSLSNADLEEIFLRDDLKGWGLDRSA